MKLVNYRQESGAAALGLVADGGIVDLNRASGGELPHDMRTFLEMGDVAMEKARDVLENACSDVSLDASVLLSPITNPSKVIAIGLNYGDHIREANLGVPNLATMFCKFPSAIIGTNEFIRWPRRLTRKIDYEAELAVVIGKTARNVSEQDAFDYIAGYMNCNDVSARDLQFREGDQWLRGKCLDTFCPLGPYLVTRDEIPDPHDLSIRCLLNGAVMQDSNTAEMIYKIPHLIRYLSEAFTLLPGDVIATGTPHGVGAFREPPVWLKSGDEVVVEIEGLGQLVNRCCEE